MVFSNRSIVFQGWANHNVVVQMLKELFGVKSLALYRVKKGSWYRRGKGACFIDVLADHQKWKVRLTDVGGGYTEAHVVILDFVLTA